MHLDLHDRATLLRSWLATLHGPELRFAPRLTGPLPGWALLLRTAVMWHVAYALVAYAGALTIAQSGSDSLFATTLHDGGRTAVVAAAVVIWWAGVGLSSALWWSAVRRARLTI